MPPTDAARPRIGAVVMAAGAGTRMGGIPKALIRRDGEALVLRQIRLLTEVGIEPIVVVLGHHAGRISAVLERAQREGPVAIGKPVGVRWDVNPNPTEDPASSLRCGLALLPVELSAVAVALGDQPLLEADDLGAMLDAWVNRASRTQLVVPRYQGQLGHPVYFAPEVRAAVLAGTGVRQWRQVHPDRVEFAVVTHDRFTTDIDTLSDWERLRYGFGFALELPPSE